MFSINIGIGVSQEDNLIRAAERAAKKAKEEIKGKSPKLLMFFCTYTYPEDQYRKAQEEIYNIFGSKSIPLMGGTTVGFFAKDKYFFDISLFGKAMGVVLKAMGKMFKPLKFTGACVVALDSDCLNVGVGLGTNVFKEPSSAGKEAFDSAMKELKGNSKEDISRLDLINALLFGPGVDKSGRSFSQKVADSIVSCSKYAVKIEGGELCGGVSNITTFPGSVFYNGEVYKESVLLTLFTSRLVVGHGVASSVEMVDRIGLVTKMKDKWTIEEINKKPAAEVIFKVLKKHLKVSKEKFYEAPGLSILGGFSLVFPDPVGKFLWNNNPAKIIDGKYARMINSGIKEGMILVLARGTRETCIEANANATKSMIEDADRDLNFVMFFSCSARGIILGKEYSQEIKQIKKVLKNKDIPIFGICSNGEVASYKDGPPTATAFIISMMGISNKIKKIK